jgi:hypothetical protein
MNLRDTLVVVSGLSLLKAATLAAPPAGQEFEYTRWLLVAGLVALGLLSGLGVFLLRK